MAALAALLLCAPAFAAEEDRRPPIDQCADNASFAAFREDLREAVARRDADFILATIADDIEVDFGGGAGREDFSSTWTLDRPQESRLWAELGEALALGCARTEDGAMWAPSFGYQLGAEDDIYMTLLALPGATLRDRDAVDGEVLATLEWDVLLLQSDDGADAWLPVLLSDGRSGYVHRDQVRSAIDYRAVFANEGGRWRMTAFIAGD